MFRPRPTEDSYWVNFAGLHVEAARAGGLLAGEYPGAKGVEASRRKINRFLDAGVTFFLDLTQAGEYGLRPYAPLAAAEAGGRGILIAHQRFAIPDLAVPSVSQMVKTLDTIDRALANGETIYVHCYGGIGRTGTVIGCWLVRYGLTGRQALAKIGAWRRGTPEDWRSSPETDAQREMVLRWAVDSAGIT